MPSRNSRAARDQPRASTSEKSQQIDRGCVVDGVGVTTCRRVQNRLAIQKLCGVRESLPPGKHGIPLPPSPRATAAYDAECPPIPAAHAIFERRPQRRVIRQADDDVTGTPDDAKHLLERHSHVGKVLDHFERHDRVERSIRETELQGVAGDRAQRRRSARMSRHGWMQATAPSPRRARAGAWRGMCASPQRSQRQSRGREGPAASEPQSMTPSSRLKYAGECVACWQRVSFAALVKRCHRVADASIRQLRRQLAVERMTGSAFAPGAFHFCAYTTNPSGNFVRLELNDAMSGLSRFSTTRLRPPALMISQITCRRLP